MAATATKRRPRKVHEVGKDGVVVSKANKLNKIVAQLQDKFGEEAAEMLASSGSISTVTNWISTQSLLLDQAIGRPGIPVGRVSLIVGATSVGKTTLTYHIMAETQRRGGIAIYLDGEAAALDKDRARQIGLDPEEVVVVSPDNLDEAIMEIEQVIDMVRAEMPDDLVVIILDSVAGLATAEELGVDVSSRQVGSHARLMGKAMRRLAQKISKHQIALILINQYREKVGVMFGPNKTMIAEHACRFYSSLVLELEPGGMITKGEGAEKQNLGITTNVYVQKNKVAKPFNRTKLRIMFENGIDQPREMFESGVKSGIIIQKGSWYMFHDDDKSRREQDVLDILATPGCKYAKEIIETLQVTPAYLEDTLIMGLANAPALDEYETETEQPESEDTVPDTEAT